MRLNTETVRGLVLSAYEAASGGCGWQAFMAGVGRLYSASSVAFFTPFVDGSGERMELSSGIDAELWSEFNERWCFEDPWRERYMARGLPMYAGAVSIGSEYLSAAELRRTSYHAGFAGKADIDKLVTAVVADGVVGGETPFAILSLTRGKAQRDFDVDAKRSLGELQPHLQQALSTWWRLRLVRRAGEAATGSLNAVPYPIWILRSDGHIEFENDAVASIPERDRALSVKFGQLKRLGQLDDICTHLPFARATKGHSSETDVWYSADGALYTGTLDLVALPVDHPLRQSWPHGSVLATLRLRESGVEMRVRHRALAQQYRLSPTESRLLRALCDGTTTGEFARQNDIRMSTVRTHISNLLAKTGTARQIDLVRLASGQTSTS